MSRPIASVHLDIARFLIEIQDAQASGGDAALGLWTRNLARSLALNDPSISTFGSHLLSEAQRYRDAEKERKKANPPAVSGGKTRKGADSSQRKKERKKDSQEEEDNAGASLGGLDEVFEEARKAFPGVKAGFAPELANLKKKHKDYADIIPLLLPAINREKNHKARLIAAGEFCPAWKNFQTWINQSCWTNEFPSIGQPAQDEWIPPHRRPI